MRKNIFLFLCFLVLLFISSCSIPQNNSTFLRDGPSILSKQEQKLPIAHPKKQIQMPSPTSKPPRPPKENSSCSLHSLSQTKSPPPLPSSPEVLLKPKSLKIQDKNRLNLDLNLEDVNLSEFLDLILKKTLGFNYIVSPSARASITAYIHGSFTKKELVNLVSQILSLQGISFIKEGNIFKIVNISEISLVGSFNFLLVRPHYIAVSSILPVIQGLTNKGALVRPVPGNILLVIDDRNNLEKVLTFIRTIDQDIFENVIIEAYSPKVLDAETLADYLNKIFQAGPLKEQHLSHFLDFIPLKETNTLFILARYPEDIVRVKNWLAELDQGERTETEVFVYPVENGDAEEIATILQNVFTNKKLSKRKTIVEATREKPTKQKIKLKNSISATISGEVKIIPDKTNNILIIRASKEDYKIIKRLLKKIDVVPRQVLIEVLIAEITLNKALKYGIEWYIKTALNINSHIYKGKAMWSFEGGNKEVASSLGGITQFVYAVLRSDELRSLLLALDSISEVNILSSPILLATDNKKASIQIGQEVPIITQEVVNTSASTPNITSSVSYRDTGIILKVKPHINSSGLVKLEIEQEVSSAQQNYLGLSSPLISKRKIKTTLIVQNNQTILLGGLIDQRREASEAGVPILKNIPFLGKFFSWNKYKTDRTELLVAITPRVVRSQIEAQEIMQKFQQKIETLRENLENKLKK